MNVMSRLEYILTPFSHKFILLLIENEETLTVYNLPCVLAYSSKLNFEPLACSIYMYRFVDLACKTLLHASATHPHRYNPSALFAQCLIDDCHYHVQFTLQWWAIPDLLWYWPKSTTERTICRCIVVMWVGGFGELMQRSLMCKVHELVNVAS